MQTRYWLPPCKAAPQDAINPFRSRQVVISFRPANERIVIEPTRIRPGRPYGHVCRCAVKAKAQCAQALDRDIPPIGFNHANSQICIASMPIHRLRTCDDIDTEVWIAGKQRCQWRHDERICQVLRRGKTDSKSRNKITRNDQKNTYKKRLA